MNPSLSLSELLFIQSLQKNDPCLRQIYYNRMLEIDPESKASELRLKQYYRQVVNEYLNQFTDIWELCNQWLDSGEMLEMPKEIPENEKLSSGVQVPQFSRQQMEAMTELMNDCTTLKMQRQLKKKTLRKKLGRLRSWLLNISLNRNR